MKAYRTIPINDCGEPLVALPEGLFNRFEPHVYMALGAPYGKATPWMLRQGILKALQEVQKKLVTLKPNWKFMIFDGYRPNAVQAYMVEREFGIKAREAGYDPANLTKTQHEELAQKVFCYWGYPSEDPATPPPHSTGAAIDCTLADEKGREVPMGSPIDEGTERSAPDYFASATNEAGKLAHANRVLLRSLMLEQGFVQNPDEWWHFSLGDQTWAWRQRQSGADPHAIARYGRADLV